MSKRYPQDRNKVGLHRRAWEQVNGPIPEGMQIDHINGDRYDNSPSNLRLVSQQENNKNKAVYRNNTAGITGLTLDRGKWKAQVKVSGKLLNLGRYADWFEAVCARMSANNLYGFHENHGRR